MHSRIEADTVTQMPPDEGFLLLGHELRIKILWALWTAPNQTTTFSELQERLDIEDNGRLNYHRDKLTDHFIKPATDEEGYTLRQAGRGVVRAIHAGTYTAHGELEPIPIEGQCADCSGTLAFRYVDNMANVFCMDCEKLWDEYAFPPGGLVDRNGDALAHAAEQRVRVELTLARRGVCPECAGQMTAALVPGSSEYFNHPVHVRYECQHCTFHPRQSLGEAVLDHPAVVAFFYEHGADVREIPRWQLPFCYDRNYIEKVSDDPLRGAVVVTFEGKRLRATLGADGTPIQFERES